MQKAVAGTDTGFESAASRFESFITWRPINHYPETGKPPSYSATPELLQLLTSSLARLFKSYLVSAPSPKSVGFRCVQNGPTDLRRNPRDLGDGALARNRRVEAYGGWICGLER